MLQPSRDLSTSSFARIGGQPIALAGVTLIAILTGTAAIASWRAYTGNSPELDRVVAAREQQQARAVQASEQLVAKTDGLEITQQESIDQLQAVQDELKNLRRQLAAQQADNKRLTDQVTSLADAVEGLRHSFASAQPSDSADSARNKSVRTRAHAHTVRTAPQKRPKTHG